jgi:hypothetical protein
MAATIAEEHGRPMPSLDGGEAATLLDGRTGE